MKEKFNQYVDEIGLRYAIHWAKYENIRCGLLQLWLAESEHPADSKEVAKIYFQA